MEPRNERISDVATLIGRNYPRCKSGLGIAVGAPYNDLTTKNELAQGKGSICRLYPAPAVGNSGN